MTRHPHQMFIVVKLTLFIYIISLAMSFSVLSNKLFIRKKSNLFMISSLDFRSNVLVDNDTPILSHEIIPSPFIDKTKPVIAFLHGILGSKRNWRTPNQKFIEKYPQFQGITIDHRGHGHSILDDVNSDNKITINTCSNDLSNLFKSLDIATPNILCAHSFGGKVAIQYLTNQINKNLPIPTHTFIIDSIPGSYIMNKHEKQSVSHIFDVLINKIPSTFPTKEYVIELIESEGINRHLALWIATNIIPINQSKNKFITSDKYTWSFDLNTIYQLYLDFCITEQWNALERFSGDGYIHYIQAGKNKDWNDAIIDKFHNVMKHNPRITLHKMENVGHNIHVDDLNGLLNIIAKLSLNI